MRGCDGYLRITAYIFDPSPGSSIYNPNLVETRFCVSLAEKAFQRELPAPLNAASQVGKSLPPLVKSACNYENTRLAGSKVILNGYDNALLLNDHGRLSESTESNVFFIDSKGELVTTSVASGILEGLIGP